MYIDTDLPLEVKELESNVNIGRPCPVCREDRPQEFQKYFDSYVKLYRCRQCGMVAQYPGPGRNTLVTEYEDEFQLDFLERGQEFYWPDHTRSFQDIVTRSYGFSGPGRLLDVGCGDGHFLSICQSFGYDCYGIDPGIKMSQYAGHKTDAQIVNGYYDADTFPTATFDAITMIQVLEHIIEPRSFLAAAYRQLKPGGIVVIEVPSAHAPHFLMYQASGVHYFVRPPRGIIAPHVNYFAPNTLEQLTHQIGFQTLEIVTGRWQLRKSGWEGKIAKVTDRIFNRLGIGGILYIGRKNDS